ncbi:hypothetical protein V1291_005634 [Nitrobacteraceae bacterium AZCC 1564]
MDGLTLFRLFAVTAMLVCYALEDRSPWFIFGFAVSCALGSAYGFLHGAWALWSCRGDLGAGGVAALVCQAASGGIALRDESSGLLDQLSE